MHSMAMKREMARDWRDQASCREEDPELFFTDGGATSPAVVAQVAEAKFVCSGCPVLVQCRSWALESGVAYGVWGGLDEHERELLRRADRRRAARRVA